MVLLFGFIYLSLLLYSEARQATKWCVDGVLPKNNNNNNNNNRNIDEANAIDWIVQPMAAIARITYPNQLAKAKQQQQQKQQSPQQLEPQLQHQNLSRDETIQVDIRISRAALNFQPKLGTICCR